MLIMKNQIILSVVFLLLIFSPSIAQVNVYHVNTFSGEPKNNGAFYILPRTVLKIDVVVKAEEKRKGPYSEYAGKFLGLEDVINFDFMTYTIDDVEITTISEPDPEQVFYVEFGERDSKEFKTLKIELDNAGFLVSANNLNLENAVKEKNSQAVAIFENPDEGANFPDFYLNKRVGTKTDTIIRRVNVDTAMVEESFLRTRVVDKTTEEMALSMIGKIEVIRESRFKLLNGFQETAYEAGTVRYMDSELKKLENDYLDLFRGKSYAEYTHYTFYYVPSNSENKANTTLFKFSTGAGINLSRNGSGENVQIELTLNGFEQAAGSFPQVTSQNGIAYRTPGYAVAKVKMENETFFEGRISINQFGVIRRLPPQKFNATFHPETGGLKAVTLD